MKYIIKLLLVLGLSTLSFAQVSLPEHMKKLEILQTQYDNALKNGGDKAKLDKILADEKAKLEAEFKENDQLEEAFNPDIVRKFKVDAKKEGGERVGAFSPGEIITIEYIEGEWSAYPGWKPESPDTAKNEKHKIVLVHREVGGKLNNIVLPQNTKNNPLKVVIERRGNYYLKINGNIVNDNTGSATYKIGVIKPQK